MPFGKSIARHVYFHVNLLKTLEPELREAIYAAGRIAQVHPGEDYNVVKLNQDRNGVSLLDYPGFLEEGFPVLSRYWTVDLDKNTARFRTYENSLNPPILHRKELLLPASHPHRETFEALTAAAEQIGLFDDPCRIGFKQAWEMLLSQRGYRVMGHELVPIGNDESDLAGSFLSSDFIGVARYLTALTRYGFSAPVQTLARFGFLDGSKTVFDYGCGRGGDVRGLKENGIEAAGWDPYYAPDETKRSAHIVNLGFVINVIEDMDERIEALQGAYRLAEELLAVSAMLANPEALRGTPYGDGILTSRNTFQKYYTQGELRAFIAEVLDEEPLPVGPGIFYVFKDKDAEQRFMVGRLENRRNTLRLSHLSHPTRPARIDKVEARYEQHRELLESLWESCLNLGRDPDRSEFPHPDAVAIHFGSLPAALRFIKSRKDNAEAVLEHARRSRIDDLRVYFALWQFEKRKPYRHFEAHLQKDIKAFFGDYRAALESGRELLFAAASPEAIERACREAAEQGVGWLEEGESLQLPTWLVVQLPAILRAYVGCGVLLYGDVSSADLIKIHIRSGKLTLMSFDDFSGKPLPRLLQRVKINLRTQELDIFDYGEQYEPPYLYRKSRFINEEFPNYAEQLAFDEALENLGLFDFSGYGPKPTEFHARLAAARWAIDGFRLVRSRATPDLDAACGRYFIYRQLIECGETQARTGLPNLPNEPDSYTALYALAVNILDPVVDYFGMIELTYGFCSPELARQIPARIAPELDQHAAHELSRKGSPICPRLGAAVDFLVRDENMEEVARWIMANLPYDRLYYYGPDKPVHVSYSERPAGEAYEMRVVGGRRVPRVFR
ncbi:DNA phosphorothioation-associated putative methyltransferase [Methylocaldum sp.]|uniref:DNA phosphorothioation-associated putative methyltransferase n=1 Tax=Methylocaldum sp. TaxID=1969727 RepID=UPI002D24F97E|nr:DNA phosphorothioation-associated putative methyltransferase [Methylocaldum sp.]HYE36004.1 DNA phosphorothioation-associated putative methyltransferase [Methylocaldum sp.]